MFKQPFNLALVRNIQQGMGFYLVFWLVAMVGSIVFSIPAIIWWGGSWQAKAEDYFKFLIIGTHAVCALFSLYLSIETAKTKGIKSEEYNSFICCFCHYFRCFCKPYDPYISIYNKYS
jgi:hypothetical protein